MRNEDEMGEEEDSRGGEGERREGGEKREGNVHVADEPRDQLGVEDDLGDVGREGDEPVGEDEVGEELEAGLRYDAYNRSVGLEEERGARRTLSKTKSTLASFDPLTSSHALPKSFFNKNLLPLSTLCNSLISS